MDLVGLLRVELLSWLPCVLVGLHRPELSYTVEIEEIGDGVMARYKGIPIVINEKLDDGIVGIE